MSIQEKINAKKNAGSGMQQSVPDKYEVKSSEQQIKQEKQDDPRYRDEEEEFLRKFKVSMERRTPVPPQSTPTQTNVPKANPADEKPEGEANGLPQEGALLRLSSGSIAVFHRDVPSKSYQVVLVLQPDGSLSPEGVNLLNSHEYTKIGQIPSQEISQMLNTLNWDRDHVIFHLDDYRFVKMVPQQTAQQEQTGQRDSTPSPTRDADWPAPKEQPAPERENGDRIERNMVRGRRFRIIQAGGQEWEAVYWCEDEAGTVVAHKTQNQWSLMHLDMRRFEKNIIFLGDLSESEMIEVEKSLRHI
ncbi:MAG: hypothetical protein ACLFUS_03840 [Candidatus Sumerlaeia bacterium]